jgi:hypothetical protein
MMPKDCNEKVEVLFFEEKINEKIASKNLFNKSKIKSQNVLLYCKDYDFVPEIQHIDLKQKNNLTPTLTNYIINKKDSLVKDFIYKGYLVDINENERKITFNYALFPALISEKFFILNADTYQTPINYDKEIDVINTKIVNKSYLRFIQKAKELKNTEAENDLYICYLIVWSLVFWYIDDCERELRFLQMIRILEKIEEHDIKTFEELFKALVEYSNDENVIIVYKKFIHLRLNPSWEIFSLVSKIIKKKQNAKKKNQLLLQETNANDLNEKFIKENKMERIAEIRERTLNVQNNEDNVFSNDVLFYAYIKCDKCKNIANLRDICSNLSTLIFEKDTNEKERIRCKNKNKNNTCNNFYESSIKLRLGKELYNKKAICSNFSSSIYSKIKTSLKGEILFLSPGEIKKQLLDICSILKKESKFDVELFRVNYPDIFWNLILYFEFNNIDITFMLPYCLYNDKKDIFKLEDEIKKHVTYLREKKKESDKENKNNEYIIDFINKKNTNNIKIFNDRIRVMYKDEDLISQTVFNFEINDDMGMLSYKSYFICEDNIGYNEIPMFATEKDNNSTSSDSLNQFNENDLSIIARQRTKHRRNLSSSDNLRYSKIVKISKPVSRQMTRNVKKENSFEAKCFEFEDSEDYSSNNEDKK